MAWIDLETGRPYTKKEIDALRKSSTQVVDQEQETAPNAAPTADSSVQASNVPRRTPGSDLENFGTGIEASLKQTYLGLKQAATYLTGNPEARQAVNDEIAKMEQEYGPILDTKAGKAGEIAGAVGQFIIPGGGAAAVGKAVPMLSKAAAKLFGQAGSVRRAATTAGGFEAAQPVAPGNTRTEDMLLQRGARALIGTAGGGAVGAVGSKLTNPGTRQISSLSGIEQEAQRVGLKGDAALTPAQRTGDVDLLQYEEGLLSSPGSQNLIKQRRNNQQEVLNKATSKALGTPSMPPTETAFGISRDTADLAYKPIARIGQLPPDARYTLDLHNFAHSQYTKATGSKDVAQVAGRLNKGSRNITGSGFLEELQGVRDLGADAARQGKSATASQFRDLTNIMEDFLERRLSNLATKPGSGITPDAFKNFKEARLQQSVLHSLEKSTDPVLGKVNPNKVLKEQSSRQRPGANPSPTTQALQDISDISRVLRKTSPYIGSSGTAERLGGQRMVEESLNPLASLRMAPIMARNYLAARHYLNHGGNPGVLGRTLPPGANLAIRRLLPPEAIGTGEALAD